jgi:hypothetical protein
LKHPSCELEKSLEAETLEAEEQLKEHEQFIAIHKSIADLPVKSRKSLSSGLREETGERDWRNSGEKGRHSQVADTQRPRKIKEIMEKDRLFTENLSQTEVGDA